jgi:hypothetical protein
LQSNKLQSHILNHSKLNFRYKLSLQTKETFMLGQMCWLSAFGADGEKILHLRRSPDEPWMPYTRMTGYAVPDYPIPGGSKGWATYQKLFKAGWTLIPSAQAHAVSKLAS